MNEDNSVMTIKEDQILDAKGLNCPLPILKTKVLLNKMQPGEILYVEATEAATNLNDVLRKVNDGQGTLGMLVNDDTLYYDTKNAVLKVEKGIDTLEDLAPLGTLGAIFGVLTLF